MLDVPSCLRSEAERLCTLPGTLSASIIKPGTGVVPITTMPGSVGGADVSSSADALDEREIPAAPAIQLTIGMHDIKKEYLTWRIRFPRSNGVDNSCGLRRALQFEATMVAYPGYVEHGEYSRSCREFSPVSLGTSRPQGC
jgi:hypothetical protein